MACSHPAGGGLGRRLAPLLICAALLLLAPAGAQAEIGSVFGGDVACAAQPDGARFCGSTAPRSTTRTFDGTPIDVNVAFPPGSDGPFPLVMLFHGYGGSKLGFSEMREWLDAGYATFSMTDRGFHESCGSAEARLADPAGCAQGYIRLMDTRYEVRDAQYLAGRLVDEGRVQPTGLGATGGSYGGGLSMALAALRDRTMMPDGSLAPWTSPGGIPMSLAAATPNIPWTDLAYSLTPNGSTLDYVADAPYRGRIGVEKQSLILGLYVLGCSANFCAPKGADPSADLTGWKALLDQGEPYDGNSSAQAIIDEITSHHSSYYIDASEPPAPLLISSGFTDDLFPVDEALRFYNRTTTRFSSSEAPISLFFGDFGHPRAQNKADVTGLLARLDRAWMDYYLKGQGSPPYLGVQAMTLTCPGSAPSGGPYAAKSWARLAPGEVRFSARGRRTIQPALPSDGSAFDPIGANACSTSSAANPQGAEYLLPKAPREGFTLMGSPTVIADLQETDANSQVAARLLDLAPDGTQTLVARGLWRPQVGPKPLRQVLQLHADGYRFEPGHVAKLELLSSDPYYGRPSNDQQPIRVSNLELRLPVLERPGTERGFVKAPAPKVVPKGYRLAAGVRGLGRAGARAAGRARGRGGRLHRAVRCPKAWRRCNRVRVSVKATAPRLRGVVAGGRLAGIRGGKTRRLSLRLRPRARRFMRSHSGFRARVATGSTERSGALVVGRRIG
jgi:predicted acyl esterase